MNWNQFKDQINSLSNKELTNLIYSKPELLNEPDDSGVFLLHKLASEGETDAVKRIIVFYNDTADSGRLLSDSLDIENLVGELDGIIEKASFIHPDINITDFTGKTALHHAAAAGSQEIIDILLKVGADEIVKDNSGKTYKDYFSEKEVPMLKDDEVALSIFSRQTYWHYYFLATNDELEQAEQYYFHEVDDDLKEKNEAECFEDFLAKFPGLNQSDLEIDLEEDDFDDYPEALELFQRLRDLECEYRYPLITESDLISFSVNGEIILDEVPIEDLEFITGIKELPFNIERLEDYQMHEFEEDDTLEEALESARKSEQGFCQLDIGILENKQLLDVVSRSFDDDELVQILVTFKNTETIQFNFDTPEFKMEKLAFIRNDMIADMSGTDDLFAIDVIYDGKPVEIYSVVHVGKDTSVEFGQNVWPYD